MAEVGQLVNAKVLAGLFNLTDRRIQQLAKEEVIPKAARGKYPFVLSIKSYIKFLQDRLVGGDAAPTGDITTERTRLYRANAEKSELELAVMKGESLPANVVHLVWTKQIGAFRAKMLSLPIKMAAELHGIENKKEIEATAKRFIWEALTELSEDVGFDTEDIGAAIASAEGGSPTPGAGG